MRSIWLVDHQYIYDAGTWEDQHQIADILTCQKFLLTHQSPPIGDMQEKTQQPIYSPQIFIREFIMTRGEMEWNQEIRHTKKNELRFLLVTRS